MPAHSASRLRGLRTVRPCTGRKLAAILAAIAARLFLHLLAATWRGPGKSKARQSLPQKKKRANTYLVVPAKAGTQRLRRCSALDPGSLCEAAKVGRIRPRAPHAGRARTARLWRQGRSPAAKPRPTAANRPKAGAQPRVHFFGYFLWASNESDSAARMADETTQDVRRFPRQRAKDKIKMDSGLRRNDGDRDSGFRRNRGGRTKKNPTREPSPSRAPAGNSPARN